MLSVSLQSDHLLSFVYLRHVVFVLCLFFFFQAEDGIRDLVRSRGLGDVYKRQEYRIKALFLTVATTDLRCGVFLTGYWTCATPVWLLSLIHI